MFVDEEPDISGYAFCCVIVLYTAGWGLLQTERARKPVAQEDLNLEEVAVSSCAEKI